MLVEGRPADWSRRHGGLDPAGVPLLRTWLWIVALLAVPFVRRRIPPLALTIAGVLAAVGAVAVVGVAPWAAFGLVVVSVLGDALDGAVAAATDRVTTLGRRADLTADRVADTCFALVLWRAGAGWEWALAAIVATLVLEGARQLRGGRALTTITVGERPTRTICTLLGCGCAAVGPAAWPVTVCTAVWLAAAVVGVARLTLSGRREADCRAR